jgi:hypothetical protein
MEKEFTMKSCCMLLMMGFMTGCSLFMLEPRAEYTELETYYLNLDFQKACPLALKQAPQREANALFILYECLQKEPGTIGAPKNNDYSIKILKEFVDRKDPMVFSELGHVYHSGILGVQKNMEVANCWSDLNGHEENIAQCVAISPELSGLKYIEFVVDKNGEGVKIK